MAEVFPFLLIIGAFVGLYFYIIISSNKDSHYKELAKYYGMSDDTIENIRKFFKDHPEKISEAEEYLKEEKKREYLYKESKKRELVKQRVFAYDYEELLYQIYAPLAEKGFRGYWVCLKGYEAEELIERIANIKKVSIDEAIDLFKILVDRQLIIKMFDAGYMLTSLLEENSDPNYKQWNVVSDTDMNLDKWMVAHGYEHKKNNKL